MAYVFEPQKCPSIAIAESEKRFPVRRIFCVGRNYADHVREMGNDPKSDPPVFFTKPADAVTHSGAAIRYPSQTSNLHYEVELVVALKSGGADIEEAAALDCVLGYAVGVDLTRRDLQALAKQAGNPWDAAKGFDDSAPVGAITLATDVGHPKTGAIRLSIDGEIKQDGDLRQMIWSVPEIIAALSQTWELKAGDLIFTGTPSGVGPLQPGEGVYAEVVGLVPLTFHITPR